LVDGFVGSEYSQTISTAGGSPQQFTLTEGVLPSGLRLDSATGRIIGIPTVPGTFSFTVDAIDVSGHTAKAVYRLNIQDGLNILTDSLPEGRRGYLYSLTLVAAGGEAPYTWSGEGLPAGLVVSNSGTVNGRPESNFTGAVVLNVSDQTGRRATRTLSLVVGRDLAILSTAVPVGTVGIQYLYA
jgi:hypothetical protein